MKELFNETINRLGALTVGFMFLILFYQFFTINTMLEFIGFIALAFFPFRKIVRLFYKEWKTM